MLSQFTVSDPTAMTGKLQVHLSAEEVGYLAAAVRQMRNSDEKKLCRLREKFGDEAKDDSVRARLRIAEQLLPRLKIRKGEAWGG